MKKNYFLLITFLLYSIFCEGQSGNLDSSFGENGIVIKTNKDTVGTFIDMAILNNDKILTLGVFLININGISLTKYLSDGLPDNSFGENGQLFIANDVYPRSLVIQKDGKIVITGSTLFQNHVSVVVARFTPDGSPDASFATNGLFVLPSDRNQYGEDVAIQKDGKIIVCGIRYQAEGLGIIYPILVRLNADGSPDKDFGDNGEKIYQNFEKYYDLNKIALQDDGKIVTAGTAEGGYSFYLVRYTNDGIPDSSFGINGEVITVVDRDAARIKDVLIQPDGKIVAAGVARADGFPRRKSYMAAVRYNTDGSLDKNFGIEGIGKVEFLNASQANSVALQNNGKIVLSGWVSDNDGNFALARLTSEGILDSTFGKNGQTITDMGTTGDQSLSLGLQQNGNIISGGVKNNYEVLARYLGDPTKPRPTIAQIKRWIRNHILHFEDANSNTAYYVIEKSTAINTGFVPVTRITAIAVKNNYSYTLPETTTQSTYRIKAVNKDNSITYSSLISSSDPAIAGAVVGSFKVYPNPAKDRITVETSGAVQLRLQNSTGRVLLTQTVNGKGGIDISKLPNGIYYVVNTLNGESLKVVKE